MVVKTERSSPVIAATATLTGAAAPIAPSVIKALTQKLTITSATGADPLAHHTFSKLSAAPATVGAQFKAFKKLAEENDGSVSLYKFKASDVLGKGTNGSTLYAVGIAGRGNETRLVLFDAQGHTVASGRGDPLSWKL